MHLSIIVDERVTDFHHLTRCSLVFALGTLMACDSRKKTPSDASLLSVKSP